MCCYLLHARHGTPCKGAFPSSKKCYRKPCWLRIGWKNIRSILCLFSPRALGCIGLLLKGFAAFGALVYNLAEVMFTMCCYLQHMVSVASTMCCYLHHTMVVIHTTSCYLQHIVVIISKMWPCSHDLVWAICTTCCYLQQLVVGRQSAGPSSPPMVPPPRCNLGLILKGIPAFGCVIYTTWWW